MTTIVIKDLDENRELDREAMRKVVGGRSGMHMSQATPYRSALQPRSTAGNELRELFRFRLGAG